MNRNYFLMPAIAFAFALNPLAVQSQGVDATWNETVGFIASKSSYMTTTVYEPDGWSRKVDDLWVNKEALAANELLFENYVTDSHIYKTRVDLEKLNFVSFEYGKIVLETTGKNVCVTFIERDIKSGCTEEISIGVSDSEMKVRLKSAFDHLAKLANQRRRAASKAAGEKF